MRTLSQICTLLVLVAAVFAYTGEVAQEFLLPAKYSTGLAFDGQNLWVADRKEAKLFALDPVSGKVVRTFSAPGYWPMGLTWDGKALWVADFKDAKIYRLDPASGMILKAIDAPENSLRDLAWDGQYLWGIDDGKDQIIQFSPEDGTTIKAFKAPATEGRGLTHDGKYLWVSDRGRDEIYLVDPQSGSVLFVTAAPGPYTQGLAFAGNFLWAVDYQTDKLYKLKQRDGVKFQLKNERKAEITLTHLTRNFGSGKIQTLDAYLALPRNRDSQVINKVEYLTKYTDIVTDQWSQECAHYRFTNIAPNTSVAAVMKVQASISEIQYFVYPDQIGSLADIPIEIKTQYLQDNEKYQITHPVILNAVQEAIGKEQNPYWIARKIFNYVNAKMFYELSGGWNTAPTVLARGNGSCSEYTFVYIAMCRAAGLPARYVGSVVVRGDDACWDDVYHRWVEVYLPKFGWLPVDPSGGDKELPRDQALGFGNLSNRFLITTESGGASTLLDWYYNFNEKYTTDPQTKVVVETLAEWEPLQQK